ncbi:hypothetical protein ACFV0O_00060 [Kitasatospora sp. NPDC059577]|uniref:hypothetical protein n=1 Tax=Kitasatospora sp. NPDC059577 TaxID=3346873 RepID=UPI0036A64178
MRSGAGAAADARSDTGVDVEVAVTGMAVAGDRLLLVVGPSGEGTRGGRAVCSLPLDGRSAEVLFDLGDPDTEVLAVTV